MLKYLLILFIVAVALAPLTNLMPSKRQRLVARMREYAAVHGLFVEFRGLPGIRRPDKQRGEQMIYYGKRLPPARNSPRPRRAWLPSEQGWRGVEHRESPPACSTELPAEILGISVDEGSCGVYWMERGDESDVEAIVAAMDAWLEELTAVR